MTNNVNFKLECPNCKFITEESNWEEDYVDCELCGNQEGIACPNCYTVFTECGFSTPREVE